MNKFVSKTILLIVSFFIMGFECEDHISSRNGPLNPNTNDTTNIIYFDSSINIDIRVLVREYDSSINKLIPSVGATVHFNSTSITVFTDSTGYANTLFQTDSMPFKYGYDVTKSGYRQSTFSNWATTTNIRDKITIYK